MRKFTTFLILNFIMTAAFSQNNLNELTVDRPGIAETPFTVAPGMYQFEVGFDYFKRYNGNVYHLPVALFRTGISKRTELRISSRQIAEKTDRGSFNGISSLSTGIKMHVIKQNKRIPETDILTNVILPIGYTSGAKNIGYEVLLLFQNDYYPNTAINYNIGYLWDFNLNKPMFSASFCFNYLPTQRVGLFVEYFSYIPNGWPGEHGVDGGLTYLLAPKFQVDLSTGISRLDNQNNFFISSGFSFRLESKRSVSRHSTGSMIRNRPAML